MYNCCWGFKNHSGANQSCWKSNTNTVSILYLAWATSGSNYSLGCWWMHGYQPSSPCSFTHQEDLLDNHAQPQPCSCYNLGARAWGGCLSCLSTNLHQKWAFSNSTIQWDCLPHQQDPPMRVLQSGDLDFLFAKVHLGWVHHLMDLVVTVVGKVYWN